MKFIIIAILLISCSKNDSIDFKKIKLSIKKAKEFGHKPIDDKENKCKSSLKEIYSFRGLQANLYLCHPKFAKIEDKYITYLWAKSCVNETFENYNKLSTSCKEFTKELTMKNSIVSINEYLRVSIKAEKKEIGSIKYLYISDQIVKNYLNLLTLWGEGFKSNSIDESDYLFKMANEKLLESFWENFNKTILKESILIESSNFLTNYYSKIHFLGLLLEKNKVPKYLYFSLINQIIQPLVERLNILSRLDDIKNKVSNFSNNTQIYNALKILDNLFTEKDTSNLDFHPALINTLLFNLLDKKNNLLDVTRTDLVCTIDLNCYKALKHEGLKNNLLKINNLLLNKESEGFFHSKNNNHLRFGITQRNIDLINSKLKSWNDKIKNDDFQYSQRKKELLNEILRKESIINQGNQLLGHIDRENFKMINKIQELNNLRNAIKILSDNRENRLESFNDLVNSQSYGKIYSKIKSVLNTNSFSIKATDSRFISDKESISKISLSNGDNPLKISVQKGDNIDFIVKGKWSPVCALRKSHYSQNQINAFSQGLPLIGPEGFNINTHETNSILTSANDSYSSFNSYSDTDYTDRSKVRSFCAGIEVSTVLPGIVKLFSPVDVNAYTRTSLCSNKTTGTRNSSTTGKSKSSSESKSNQLNLRSDASFNKGLRLPNTPFPDLPVGSLVLVQMQKNKYNLKESIIDLKVLQNNTSIFVEATGDYYFVINDCYDPNVERPNYEESLSLTYTHSRPISSLAKNYIDKALEALNIVQEERKRILTVKNLSSLDVNLIKSRIEYILKKENETNVEKIQKIFSSLFTYWVNSDLSILELQVRETKVQDDIKRIENEISIYKKQILDLSKSNKVSSIIENQIIDNLDLNSLTESVYNYLDFIDDYYLPLLSLSFPEIDKENLLKNSQSSNNTLLSEFEIDENIYKYIKVINDTFTKVIDEVENLNIHNQTRNELYIHSSYDISESSYLKDFSSPKVDILRANKVWKSINTKGSITNFKIEVEDLYGSYFYGHLDCYSYMPVVEAISLFVPIQGGFTSSYLNNALAQRKIPIHIDSSLNYVMKKGIKNFQLLENGWKVPKVNILFGQEEDMITTIKKYEDSSYSGQGLSPFMSFDINLSNVFQNHNVKRILRSARINKIMLVLKVSYKTSNTPLSWIKSCEDL